MRWAVGCVATVALAVGCSSPLAPLRSNGGRDAAVDGGTRPIGPTVVDAGRDVGRGLPVIDAAPDIGFVGRPDPLTLGLACRSAADCITDYCVDGVCCNSACIGPCLTCAAPGGLGTCLTRTAGTVPRVDGGCAANDPVTCGLTGLCDGRGGCATYPSGTVCAPPACLDGVRVRSPALCDGVGGCHSGPVTDCTPYTCSDGACYADDCMLNPADCLSAGNRDASSD